MLSVLYLIFNEGYTASAGDALIRRNLCDEAIRLARVLVELFPEPDSDLLALFALFLLVDARREARADSHGDLVLLPDQDRTRWDRAKVEEGLALVLRALGRGAAGSFGLEAAIAAVHAEAESSAATDWPQIVGLYDRLLEMHPSPVVALNRAAAVAMVDGPEVGLASLDALTDDLADYQPWHATRADLLRRAGRPTEAINSYERALRLTQNASERRFLERRLAELAGSRWR